MTGTELATTRPLSAGEWALVENQANTLAVSDIIPKAYQRKPANVIVAAITGRTYGWDPLTAMRMGHVIEGTYTIKPEAMLALARRAGHSVAGSTSPETAEATGKRCDTGDTMTVRWTMENAAAAGLAKKDVWQKYPASMLWARAVSQLCRMLFPDVLLGISYTPEELGADVDEDGDPIEATYTEAPAMLDRSSMPVTMDSHRGTAIIERCRALPEANRRALVAWWKESRLSWPLTCAHADVYEARIAYEEAQAVDVVDAPTEPVEEEVPF